MNDNNQEIFPTNLQFHFSSILSNYQEARRGPYSHSEPVVEHFQHLVNAFEQLPAVHSRKNLRVKFSVGLGNWAKVPWIAFLDNTETNSTQDGVYPVILFREDCSGFYLKLAMGVTKIMRENGKIRGIEALRERANRFAAFAENLPDRGFSIGVPTDDDSTGSLGQAYSNATIAGKYYPSEALPKNNDFIADLCAVLESYDRYLESRPIINEPIQIAPQERTIAQAAEVVLLQHNSPMSVDEIYEEISSQRLYSFGAAQENIKGVLKSKIESFTENSLWPDRRTISKPALFHRLEDGRYELIKPRDDTEFAPYTIDDALHDLFIQPEQLHQIISKLKTKKNVILKGPPGVGKTFMAKRIAYSLVGSLQPDQVTMIQFHQSYSYEDFVQGYRPTEEGFTLKDGIFHQFCANARARPDVPFIFIIDEINRGNLSKIFGELMMLIESDKRGDEWSVPLTYSNSIDEKFSVPENVCFLGLMNTADRSLAMVDYALRRRFVFIDIEPGFETQQFTEYLVEHGAEESFVTTMLSKLQGLNRKICDDVANLGKGFRIGHSFFSGLTENEKPDSAWYNGIITTEIAPLLEEYWFDSPDTVNELLEQLLMDE